MSIKYIRSEIRKGKSAYAISPYENTSNRTYPLYVKLPEKSIIVYIIARKKIYFYNFSV